MRLKVILAALLLAAIAAAPASAVVLGLDWGTGQSPVSISYNGTTHNVYAGSLKGYLGGHLGNPLPPHDGTYFGDTFCVDLSHTITIPTEYEVDLLPTSQLVHGGRLAWLYKNYIGSAKTDGETAAALQLALWDVVVDGGDGFNTGNFRLLSGATSKTHSLMVNMVADSENKTDNATYFRTRGPYGQSMISVPVPEPGTFGLLGLGIGLVGLGFIRKRS
jgi:hypothetical protein